MTTANASSPPRRLRFTLRTKLVAAIVSVSAIMWFSLLTYFGPQAEQGFEDGSDALIAASSSAVREATTADNRNSQRVLADLVRHSTDARKRDLEDLPMSLYDGDPVRIRAAIESQDSARATTLQKNIRVLGAELERRSRERVDRHVAELTEEQHRSSSEFGARLRTSFLMLSGGMLIVLLTLLAFGLDRFIVRPVHRLKQATRQVAIGDLAVEFDKFRHDELGDLAGDFEVMVHRLREAREDVRDKSEQLEQWNQTLQREVSNKTRHLEEALADLKVTRHKLVHADKMASLGTLAGGIAHEFNNLIGGIRGCVTDAFDDETRPEHRETLEIALRATERAASITGKLLRFARPRIDGVERIPLEALVSEVVHLVEPQARRQGVTIESRIPDDVSVVVDTGEIHQVILNLITNALQAMPAGGDLSIVASRTDGLVEIQFTDTGNGIPADRMSHVFDPFYTSKTPESGATEPGTGLGLSVSYGIVEAHGGTLSVTSELDVGSTFTVRLPEGGPNAQQEIS